MQHPSQNNGYGKGSFKVGSFLCCRNRFSSSRLRFFSAPGMGDKRSALPRRKNQERRTCAAPTLPTAGAPRSPSHTSCPPQGCCLTKGPTPPGGAFDPAACQRPYHQRPLPYSYYYANDPERSRSGEPIGNRCPVPFRHETL
jgi:hypothetical protein